MQVSLPVFVLGALAPLFARDIGLGADDLGLAVAAYFAASAGTSVWGGRLSDRLGWGPVLVVGTLATVLVVVFGAVTVRVPSGLVVLLGTVGVLNGATQPAATEALTASLPRARHGVAFGVKHAAVPAASLVAGLSVPSVALSYGWRWTMAALSVAVSVPLVVVLRRAPRRVRSAATVPAGGRASFDARLVAFGGCLAAAAANGSSAFLVSSAVDAGLTHASAAWILSASSLASIGSRFSTGWFFERLRDARVVVAAMILIGGVGAIVLARAGASPALTLGGGVLLLGGGWGWTAALGLGAVRDHPRSPAAATGTLHAGTFAGGVVGPPLFGWISAGWTYASAWFAMCALSVVAVVLILVSRSIRDRVHATPTGDGTPRP